MTAKLIKGTEIREVILEEVKSGVEQIKEKHGVVPGLVTILVGENPASISYVTLKIKTAERLGFKEIQDSQPEDISEEDLLALVDKYNKDESINGILVQLPLPKHIDEKKVLNAIDPDKDVDGFHPVNVGRLMIGGEPSLSTGGSILALNGYGGLGQSAARGGAWFVYDIRSRHRGPRNNDAVVELFYRHVL